MSDEKVTSNELLDSFTTESSFSDVKSAFKTVSPSNGLNAIPASFFTTTPRFLKDVTTELPDTIPGDFLPTLTPLCGSLRYKARRDLVFKETKLFDFGIEPAS